MAIRRELRNHLKRRHKANKQQGCQNTKFSQNVKFLHIFSRIFSNGRKKLYKFHASVWIIKESLIQNLKEIVWFHLRLVRLVDTAFGRWRQVVQCTSNRWRCCRLFSKFGKRWRCSRVVSLVPKFSNRWRCSCAVCSIPKFGDRWRSHSLLHYAWVVSQKCQSFSAFSVLVRKSQKIKFVG